MDLETFALCNSNINKALASVTSGYAGSAVTDNADGSKTLTINFVNGDKAQITFSPVKGETGTSVADLKITTVSGVRHLTATFDDGTTKDCGVLPNEQYDDTQVKSDISDLQTGKVDKVTGKSLVDDTEIARLAKVDNYDDTTLKTTIQTVANGLMASAGYSADYKSIEIISVGGTKKSIDLLPIISHAKVTDLSDVDVTDQADGKTLVFNGATGKHEYKTVEGTDEKVKMTSAGDSKYMEDLIDKDTIVNESGTLKAKTLDGLEASIAELNYIKGLQMPVQDLVNAFANGGLKTIDTPFATYADLQSYDVSTLLDDIRYLVRVLADETHAGKITAYLIKKDQTAPTFYGFLSDSRDFTTNPIDLVNEITGKLKAKNIDSDDLFALLTLSDVYKTATTKDEIFGTNGAKAMYDELSTAIGGKANTADFTTHTSDTDIHVTSAEKDEIKKIKDKADATALDDKEDIANKVTTLSNASTDKQYPSAKTVWEFFGIKTVETGSIKEWALDDTNCPRGRRTYVYCQDVVTDLPTTGEWWYVMVDKPDILTTNLVAKPIKSNKEYHCYYRNDSSTWSDWNSNIISSDITTTINGSSTNSQIPTAKVVWDNIKTKNTIQPTGTIANYSTIFDWAVNNVGATCGYEGNNFTDCPLDTLANTWGTLVCIGTKVESGLKVLFCTNFNKEIYIRTIQRRNGANEWVTSWQKICSTSVADKSFASLTSLSSNYTLKRVNGVVKNGFCMCTLGIRVVNPVPSFEKVASDMPMPYDIYYVPPILNWSNASELNTTSPLHVTLLTDGTIRCEGGIAGKDYYTTVSYPVKES